MLMGHGVAVTLIDVKPAQIEVSGTFGAKVYYGDGRRVDLLRTAGADDAALILLCLDDPSLEAARVDLIIKAFPQASVFVRTFDRRQEIAFAELALRGRVREVFESAVKMGIDALAALGADADEIRNVEADYRERDARRLAAQAETGDLFALKEVYLREGLGH